MNQKSCSLSRSLVLAFSALPLAIPLFVAVPLALAAQQQPSMQTADMMNQGQEMVKKGEMMMKEGQKTGDKNMEMKGQDMMKQGQEMIDKSKMK